MRNIKCLLAVSAALVCFNAANAAPDNSASWVDVSNANTNRLIEAQAKFVPEQASSFGLAQYDGLAIDLGPHIDERLIASMQLVRADLKKRQLEEKDARVRQDIDILIASIDNDITSTQLENKYLLPWSDLPQLMFGSMLDLLQEQLPAERRAKALERLQRYVGIYPGSESVTKQAEARFMEKLGKPGLLGPTKERVDKSLTNVPTYIKGIRDLFAKMKIEGAEPTLAAMEKQLNDYAAWERAKVLPVAREDFKLPPELYALSLKQMGINIDPQLLIQRAQVEFMETRSALQQIAPVVAKKLAIDASDYRDVIRAMKKNTIPNDQLEAFYKKVNVTLEEAIRTGKIVEVPNRPMIMRLASDAESAAQPAPHFQPPQLIGNTGEQGQFILPVGNPAAAGKSESYDDFNFPGAAWTLSAHEGRPGHELQFSAMIEHGVSQARSLYAFNSVNVEGWALYAEAEMVPFEPAEGQMIALQLRLLRAARAMLDPMLNLGLITREEAGRILTDEVLISPAMARQELDRYTLNMPAQAGSYFYGYSRLLQLRAETELALGAKFDRFAFNNFLLSQGLLPPDLLAKAVREEFVPAQKAKAVLAKN
ncbi:DUF885 domain-containing protein [Solimicrobium silvestre]|uniref:DUF885 domain-containing protein n=1 Tax=Solimicrobium silvestre TaxID=2099400 RepID=A0A2S9GV41_9BURK|nr:DUF885 domain-containing protein [Solimicrobium silvestre]PRC91602.1 hypothetical protein S2091_3718 [Solimicrobium silvestre]